MKSILLVFMLRKIFSEYIFLAAGKNEVKFIGVYVAKIFLWMYFFSRWISLVFMLRKIFSECIFLAAGRKMKSILLVFMLREIFSECVVLAAGKVKVNPLNFIGVYVLTNIL